MASIANSIEGSAPALASGTRAGQSLMKWLSAELKERAPGSAHHQLAEAFLRALSNKRTDDGTWVLRAILKQEVWRLLVTLRASGKDNSEAIAEFEAIIPGLAQRMELDGVGRGTVREVDEWLQEALEDVRDWPLV